MGLGHGWANFNYVKATLFCQRQAKGQHLQIMILYEI